MLIDDERIKEVGPVDGPSPALSARRSDAAAHDGPRRPAWMAAVHGPLESWSAMMGDRDAWRTDHPPASGEP
jgi:hypothetical protein